MSYKISPVKLLATVELFTWQYLISMGQLDSNILKQVHFNSLLPQENIQRVNDKEIDDILFAYKISTQIWFYFIVTSTKNVMYLRN